MLAICYHYLFHLFVVSESSQPANVSTTSEFLPASLTVVELMSCLTCCQMSGTANLKSLVQDIISGTVSTCNSLIVTNNQCLIGFTVVVG